MRTVVMTSLVLLLGAISAYGADEFGWRKVGEKAPEVNIDVLYGDAVKLSEGVGKHVYIVEFWATWCGPCKFSIPHLSKLQEKYRDDGLVIVGISDESEDLVRPYVDGFGEPIRYSIAIDRVNTTHSRYLQGFGVNGIPISFVVDVQGRVVWYGHPSSEFLEKLVVALLADVSKDEPTDSEESLEKSSDSGSPEETATD